MKKVFIKIGLCLISLLILLPTNVKALNEYEVVDNSYTYILRQAESVGDGQNEPEPESESAKYKADVCSASLRKLFQTAWRVVMYLLPPLLILMTSIDFFKAITSGDQDKLKKSSSDALKRTLAFVLLIMLKFILSTIFGWVGLDLCL